MRPARPPCGATRTPGRRRRSGRCDESCGNLRRQRRTGPSSVGRPLGQAQMPIGVVGPVVTFKERILCLRTRLGVTPVTVQHVLLGLDQLPRMCHRRCGCAPEARHGFNERTRRVRQLRCTSRWLRRTFRSSGSLQTSGAGCSITSEAAIVEYELAHYILDSLPADDRRQTIATLLRFNPTAFRLMRETIVRASFDAPRHDVGPMV